MNFYMILKPRKSFKIISKNKDSYKAFLHRDKINLQLQEDI